MQQPMVSVRVVTYNHEAYITQCIEGILMQKTDFPFEVIIGEDCSKDRTREIVVAYQKKYPDKITALLPEQNLGPARNNLQVYQTCQGKYHAWCEGDDYWIDPLKLQKQVDLMEAQPAISLCFHNAFMWNRRSAVTRLYFEKPVKEILDFDAACQINIPTASVLARSEILATLPEWRLKVWCSDVVFRLWCAHHGNLGYIDDIMSVYRVHRQGLVGGAAARRAKYYEEEMFVYRQLDQDTQHQHSAALQAQLKNVYDKYWRRRNQITYYLTHPIKVIDRLREYYQFVKRYRSI
jgi:glycosyltransferase involved in cell wall biosynthesis